jgi:hypothetical protein
MTLNSSAGSFLYGANNKASGFTTPNFTEGVLFDGTVTITGITITSVSTGCVTTLADITVTVNPKPTATVTATPTCFGGSNGTATANPVGGTSPYSYLWNTTGTTQTITALAPATYFVTVSDANGCSATANGNVIQGASLTATSSTTNVSCFGGNNGSGTVTPTGGITPYTYLWSSGQTTDAATGLTAGSYLITVTDAATCSAVVNLSVGQPTSALSAGTPTSTPRTCAAANGTATVTPAGGTSPYTYLWTGGQTTATATGLTNTNYNVTVTDANGCTAVTFVTVGITPNPTPGAGNTSPVCAGIDIDLTATGGTSYAWSAPSGYTASGSPATITNPTAAMNNNIYTVTVTDANGCTATTTTQITVYPLPVATAANSGVVCPGSDITLTATGGTNYAWSGPNGYTATGTPATISAVTFAQNGEVYTVTVTDGNSCTRTATTTIAVNPQPAAPIVTDRAICLNEVLGAGQGLTASSPGLTFTTSTGSITATGTGGASFGTVYGAPNVPMSITVPAAGAVGGIPVGATVTGVTVGITYTSINGSFRSELRTRVTPPVGYNAQVTDIQPKTATNVAPAGSGGTFTGLIDPNSNPTTAPAWPNANPAGTWLFEFRETFNDGGDAVQDATIDNITITVNYSQTANAALTWWDAPTGGTQIGTGTPFNPTTIPVASGGVDISVIGSTTYYAQITSLATGCVSDRVAAVFTVDPPASADAGADIVCVDGTLPISVSGIFGGTASSGTWTTSGTGTFSNVVTTGTTVTADYTPGAADINATSVSLIFTTDDPIGGCVSATDNLTVSFIPAAPITNSYTTCPFVSPPTGEGLAASCPSSLPAIPGSSTVVANGPIDVETASNIFSTTTLSIPVTAASVPANATITGVVARVSYTAFTASWTADLTVRVTPPAATGAARTSTSITGETTGAGTLTDAPINLGAGTWTLTPSNVQGNWLFEFTDEFNDTVIPDETVANVSLVFSYTTPAITPTWWTASTGGTQVGTGGIFDPTAVALPDGADVTQVGTTTYYVQCTSPNGCNSIRTAADFIVESGLVVDAGADQNCLPDNTTSVSLTGTVSGLGVTTGTWSGGLGTFTDPTNLTTTYNPTPVEVQNGYVTLTLTSGDPVGPCGPVSDQIVITLQPPVPTATDYTICQFDAVPAGEGLDASCFSRPPTPAVSDSVYLTGSGGTSSSTTYFGALNTPISITFPSGSIPAGANVTAVRVRTTYTALGGSFLSELRIRATPPAQFGALQNDIQLSTNSFAGTVTNALTGTWGAFDPAGTWTFDFRETFDDTNAGSLGIDATIDNIRITADYTIPADAGITYQVNWWDAATGGNLVASNVDPFNATAIPIVSGGIDNTVPGTKTYYAECYNVTGNCGSPRAAAVFTVNPLPVVDAGPATLNACVGNDITLTGTVTIGGIPANGTWTSTGTGTFADATALNTTYTPSPADYLAGTITLTLTSEDPAGPCGTVTDNIVVTFGQVTITTSAVDAVCFGGTGTVSVTVNTGASPYGYLWSNNATTASTAAVAGTYSVTVTDANGCSTSSATIKNQHLLTASAVATDALCNGGNGSVALTVGGGTAGYTYLWDDTAASTTEDLASVVASTYNVTVTDANGCSTVASATVAEPTLLTASAVATDALCNGGNGSVVVTASGGTSPYTGEGTFTETAGTYTYTVTDDNGCSATASATVSEPTLLTASAVATDALCNGGNGSVVVTASGGTSPYTGEGTFTETAGTYTYTVTDDNGCSATASATVGEPSALLVSAVATDALCNGGTGSVVVTASGGTSPYTGEGTFTETAGTYTYTVTDNNGCSTTASATVSEPTLLTASAVATDALCNGGNGSVVVTASGGTSPYTGEGTFTETAGTYTYTVTDDNGCSATASATVSEPTLLTASAVATDALCNGGNGSVVVTASGGTSPYTGEGTFTETAGTYTYTVTDDNGCSATASATVGEPSALLVSAVATDALCNGGTGSVVVTASGGTSPYTGEGTFTETAGTYTYTVTDDNGCSATASATVGEPSALLVSAVATDAGCNGGTGSVVVTASGGTSPYTGEGTFTEVAGTYTYTVTDDNGCSATASATVGQAGGLVVSAVATDALCNGGNGSVVVTASGGTSPYTGEGTFSELAGTYTYTVTDDNGCSATASATVSEPTKLIVSAVATDAGCATVVMVV